MGYDRGGRPVLPDLALPPDLDQSLPDLGRTSGTVSIPPDEYRPLRGPRRMSPPMRSRDEDRPLPPLAKAALLSIPSGMIVVISLIPGGILGRIPLSAIPLAMLLMAVSQLAGWLIGRSSGAKPIARICLMNLVVLMIIVPALALQASAARVPYVSTALGTATPAIVATVAAAVLIILSAVVAVALGWEGPDTAGLLFTPVALLVPEMLGGPFNPPIDTFVDRLREVFAVMVVLTIAVTILPRFVRLLVPPVLMAMLFLALWVLGRGPTFQPTSGDVVRVLDGSLLTISVILLVAVPVVSIVVRRIEAEMLRPIGT